MQNLWNVSLYFFFRSVVQFNSSPLFFFFFFSILVVSRALEEQRNSRALGQACQSYFQPREAALDVYCKCAQGLKHVDQWVKSPTR